MKNSREELSNFFTLNITNSTKNVIATTAIGGQYFDNWSKFSKKSWQSYIEKFDIGLIVVKDDLVDKQLPHWKNAAWQKLLIPSFVKEQIPGIEKIALIDTDIVISPIAPNLFHLIQNDMVGVVSQEINVPYPLDVIKRRIAFLRNKFYDSNYKLDSILFATIEQLCEIHDLPVLKNYFCSGLILVGQDYFDTFKEWFYEIEEFKVASSVAWEEPYINSWVQTRTNVKWLDYQYQSLWNYEMAWKYPFLYELGDKIANSELSKKCVEYSLWNNYFLHFAGAWYESLAWKSDNFFSDGTSTQAIFEFEAYRKQNLTGNPVGKILPTIVSNPKLK